MDLCHCCRRFESLFLDLARIFAVSFGAHFHFHASHTLPHRISTGFHNRIEQQQQQNEYFIYIFSKSTTDKIISVKRMAIRVERFRFFCISSLFYYKMKSNEISLKSVTVRWPFSTTIPLQSIVDCGIFFFVLLLLQCKSACGAIRTHMSECARAAVVSARDTHSPIRR